MTEEKKYCRVPIKLIIKFGDIFPFDTFLKLSDSKVVKISHQNEDIKTSIVRYHQTKGVQDIYVEYNDYIKFAEMIKTTYAEKLNSGNSTVEEKIEILEKSYDMIKDSFVSIGINEMTVAVAQRISESTFKMVNDYPNVFALIKKFSDKCPEEFKRSIIIGYLATGMLESFDWKSDVIKEKCCLAAMLCDILVPKDNFKLMNSIVKGQELTEEQKKFIAIHPFKTVQAFSNEKWIAKEVLTIIEQHHEEPDGSGYPNKLVHQRISQLSAIVIVAMRFTDLLFESEVDIKKKNTMLFHMRERYSAGNFKKCVQALSKTVNEIPEEVGSKK